MTTVEERLRDALRGKAKTYTMTEPAESMEQVNHRIKRKARQRIVGGVVGVAAASAVALLAVPAIMNDPPAQQAVATRRTATPDTAADARLLAKTNALLARSHKHEPPIGNVVLLTPPPGAPGTKLYMWIIKSRLPKKHPGYWICILEVTKSDRRASGCGVHPQDKSRAGSAELHGGHADRSTGQVKYGAADGSLGSVSAVLKSGSQVPGVIEAFTGSPDPLWQQAWQVAVPWRETIATLVFKDRAGKVIKEITLAK